MLGADNSGAEFSAGRAKDTVSDDLT